MRLIYVLLIGLVSFTLVAQEEQFTSDIYFATASSTLSAEATKSLDALADQVRLHGDYQLSIAAHTDSRGSDDYNDALAKARAQAVADYLTTLGITTDNTETLAFGESQAGNDLGSAQRLQANRRVDVIVDTWAWEDLDDFQEQLRTPLQQQYTIQASENEFIRGSKGGGFFIPAGTLVNAIGETVEGEIQVELTECYTIADMVAQGLTTTAQDRILESGGMFRLEAFQNGEPLQVRDGGEIQVSVPTDQYRQNMSLFYGQGHDESTIDMDWENTEEAVSSTFPRLRLAPRPNRPLESIYEAKYLTLDPLVEEEDPRAPKEPRMSKPRRPRPPNYDEIVYQPKGLEKVFLSKADRDARTTEMRDERKERYETSTTHYQERQQAYDAAWLDYKMRKAAYETLKAAEVDEDGQINSRSRQYVFRKAMADSVYEQALLRYRRDSMGYEGYRARKLSLYEQQIAAFEANFDGNAMLDKGMVSSYFLAVNKLGWANIDRFYKEDLDWTMLAATDYVEPTNEDAMVFLLMPERNIILRMNYQSNQSYELGRAPIGENAKILAIKIQDKRAYIASEEITISDQMNLSLDFEPRRLRDIRAELEAI